VATILIVEDEFAVARGIQYALQQEGYEVTIARSGEEGLEFATTQAPDLIVLDVRLPGMDGFEVLRRLRAVGSKAPVLFLTARGDEFDKVVGLELGADDYIVKPFGFRELLARIRAVMRRARPGTDRAQIHVGSLEIDVRGRRATMRDDTLNLTTKEFDLLALLASEPGDVVSRQRILREVWDTEWFGPTKTVDVHVASLRKKLGDPGWIETVRGIGLRLVARP
jgi:two-component system response regulator RegX3